MDIRKEAKWLCENAHALERLPGQWVLFDGVGTVQRHGSLARLLRAVATPPSPEKKFVFHVPSKRELAPPVLALTRP